MGKQKKIKAAPSAPAKAKAGKAASAASSSRPAASGDTLRAKREAFCNYYARDAECFGNAKKAYLKAYGTMDQHVAESGGSRLLSNVEVCARINALLEGRITDDIVDKELAFVVLQHANLPAKIAGIREYNKVKGRVAGGGKGGGSGTLTGTLEFRWQNDDEEDDEE